MGDGEKKKIVILGGGAGGLAAAWGLTSVPGWESRYEVTVYQLGWRLGGKGMTGRNRQYGDRVEEHGEHLWSGFYQNAFHTIRRCYRELVQRGLREPEAPLATWKEAFKPSPDASFAQRGRTRGPKRGWTLWKADLQPQGGASRQDPGGGGRLLDPGEMLEAMFPFFLHYLRTERTWRQAPLEKPGCLLSLLLAAWRAVLRLSHGLARLAARPIVVLHRRIHRRLRHLRLNRSQHGERIEAGTSSHGYVLKQLTLASWLTNFYLATLGWIWPDLERIVSMLDLGSAWMRGIIEDGVLTRGFDVIDGEDFGEWLAKHGASRRALNGPGTVQGAYDYLFSYEKGEADRGNLAAGTILRMLLRLFLVSQGAPWWRMRAGFGDTVFVPLYLVLRDRGVRFEFFHRAERLDLSVDQSRVDTILLTRQVDLKAVLPDRAPHVPKPLPGHQYQPLVGVRGLPCWPAEPLYDQIVDEQAEELKRRGIDLESAWTDWQDRGEVVLRHRCVAAPGEEIFDEVVLATSLDPLRHLTPHWPAVEHLQPWHDMLGNLQTVQTLSLQLWLRPTLEELGLYEQQPMLTGYAPLFSSQAEMTDVLLWEDWKVGPGTVVPHSLTYFCGVLPDAPIIPPAYTRDPKYLYFPSQQTDRVRAAALDWMRRHLWRVWPASGRGVFDFRRLAVVDGTPMEKFDAQYWRANIDPPQRYVLSTAGSTGYRLRAHERGLLANVYLAGDWVRTGLNCGCVEAAVMGGLQASRALCGSPELIWGESDFQTWTGLPDEERA